MEAQKKGREGRPDRKHACVPENARNFKYATRTITDDDALVLVEQLLDKVTTLRDMGDRSEDWAIRLAWLQSLVSELRACPTCPGGWRPLSRPLPRWRAIWLR